MPSRIDFALCAVALALTAGSATWAITVPYIYDRELSVDALLSAEKGELPQGAIGLLPSGDQRGVAATLPWGTTSLTLKGRGSYVPSDLLSIDRSVTPQFINMSAPPPENSREPPPENSREPKAAALWGPDSATDSVSPIAKASKAPQPFTVLDLAPLVPHFTRGVPMVELEAGQELTLSSLTLYLAGLPSPLGPPEALRLDLLAPSLIFRVPAGASLRLSDVTLVLSVNDRTQLYQHVCNTMSSGSYSPGVSMDAYWLILTNRTSRATGANGTAGQGGLVFWDSVKVITFDLPLRGPCASVTPSAGSDVVSLAALFTTAGPLIFNVASDMVVSPDAAPVLPPPDQPLVLLGDPDRTPTLDFSGARESLLLDASLMFPRVTLSDLVIVNLPRPVKPNGPMSLLSVSMHTFRIVRGKLLRDDDAQIQLVRCTIVVPDAEVKFLWQAAQGSTSDVWPGVPSGGFQLKLRDGIMVAPSQDRLEIGRMRLMSEVLLFDCVLLAASSYEGIPPLLPQSSVWLPELMKARDLKTVTQWGPGGLAVVPGLQQALEALAAKCGQRQDYNPVQLIGSDDDIVPSLDPQATPPPLAIVGGAGSLDSSATSTCVVDSYPEEVMGGRTFTDLKGAIARFHTLRPVVLRNLVLYNLAPGGIYPLNISLSRRPLEGMDVPWANSALPLWFFNCKRGGNAASNYSALHSQACVVLENVTLVVPEREWRAFVAAVLLEHAPLELSGTAARQSARQQLGLDEPGQPSQPPPSEVDPLRWSEEPQQGQVEVSHDLIGAAISTDADNQLAIRPTVYSTPFVTDGLAGDPVKGGGPTSAVEGTQSADGSPDTQLTPLSILLLTGDVIMAPDAHPPSVPQPPSSPPSVPSVPPYLPSSPPSPPYSSTTRGALTKFAAASRVLTYDYRAGVLVLATACHYGWVGTNVTITHRLPPDASQYATLLRYPDLPLPYTELAEIPIDIEVDFTAKTAPLSPVQNLISISEPDALQVQPPLPQPVLPVPAYSPAFHPSSAAPSDGASTGRRAEKWQIPVAATMGGTLLIAIVVGVLLVRAHRAQQANSAAATKSLTILPARKQHSCVDIGDNERPRWTGRSTSQNSADIVILYEADPEGGRSSVQGTGVATSGFLESGLSGASKLQQSCCPLAGRCGAQPSGSASVKEPSGSDNTSEANRSSMQQTHCKTGAIENASQQDHAGHPCESEGTAAPVLAYGSTPGKAACIVNVNEEAFKREVVGYFSNLKSVLSSVNEACANDGEDPILPTPSNSAPPGSQRESITRRSFSGAIHALQAELRDADLCVDAVIGHGAYGVVYRGLWRGLPVAVKTMVISEAAVGREGLVQHRAVLEAAISMSLVTHPNVVASYSYDLKLLVHQPSLAQSSPAIPSDSAPKEPDVDVEHGISRASPGHHVFKLFIVQEYCNGGSMRHALEMGMAGSIRAGGLPRLLALRLALDVARGMEHIHASRIVHGDLKPDNVLLALGMEPGHPCGSGLFVDFQGLPRLVAKVADFGLSLPLSEGATHASNRFHGTPAYSAPEVLSTGLMSPRSDVWSFGLMLLELYYGCPLSEMRAVHAALLEAGRVAGPPAMWIGVLLSDMLGSPDGTYAELTAECLSQEPRARPDFGKLVLTLQALRDSGSERRS